MADENDISTYVRKGFVRDVTDEELGELVQLLNTYTHASRVSIRDLLKVKEVLLLLTSTKSEFYNRRRVVQALRRVSDLAYVDMVELKKYLKELRKRLDIVSGHASSGKTRKIGNLVGSLNQGLFAFLEESTDNKSAKSAVRIAEFMLDTVNSLEKSQVEFIKDVYSNLSSVGEYQHEGSTAIRDKLLAEQKRALAYGITIDQFRDGVSKFTESGNSLSDIFSSVGGVFGEANLIGLAVLFSRLHDTDLATSVDRLSTLRNSTGRVTENNLLALLKFTDAVKSSSFPTGVLFDSAIEMARGSKFLSDNFSEAASFLVKIVKSSNSARSALQAFEKYGDFGEVDAISQAVVYQELLGSSEEARSRRVKMLHSLRDELKNNPDGLETEMLRRGIMLLEKKEVTGQFDAEELSLLTQVLNTKLENRFEMEKSFFNRVFAAGTLKDYLVAGELNFNQALFKSVSNSTELLVSAENVEDRLRELDGKARQVGIAQTTTVDQMADYLENLKLDLSFGVLDEIRSRGLDIFNLVKNSFFMKSLSDFQITNAFNFFNILGESFPETPVEKITPTEKIPSGKSGILEKFDNDPSLKLPTLPQGSVNSMSQNQNSSDEVTLSNNLQLPDQPVRGFDHMRSRDIRSSANLVGSTGTSDVMNTVEEITDGMLQRVQGSADKLLNAFGTERGTTVIQAPSDRNIVTIFSR